MSSIADWLAAKFITQDSIDTQAEVAAAQQRELDRQYSEGKRGFFEYYGLSREVQNAGVANQKFVDDNSNIFATVPWWVWVSLIGCAFWYLGGFVYLRGILAKK